MIGFFPAPYPDELLYSVGARFNERMRYPNISTTVKELFGSRNVSAIVDLPSRLNILIKQLPPNHLHTIDQFINDNTLLPFYAPFIPPERLHRCKEDMHKSNGNHVRERLGITAGRLRSPRQLRFCPSCVIEDRDEFGETYWHRIHQVTGNTVCPKHAVFLELSNTSWRNRRSPGKFNSAERSIQNFQTRLLNPSNRFHSMFLKIALDAAWLLHENNLNCAPEILRTRYYNLLLQRGYAYYNGRIRTGKLLGDFINFYSSNFLIALQCPIRSKAPNWLTRLVVKEKSAVIQHPLRHLLLITFLNQTAKQFFTAFEEYKPFGDGPWPCLNRASNHFHQPLVTKCRIVDSLVKGKAGRPMGIFSCQCGFNYTRMGPDTSEDARLRMDSVQSYGALWNEELRRLWADTSITIREAARRLAVYEATVVRQAIRLGLSYPRNILGEKTAKEDLPKRKIILRQPIEDVLESRRREWMKLVQAMPNASRRDLINTSYYLYFWLKRNDSEWFERHLPPPRRVVRLISLIDWKHVDNKLSAAVKASAIRIKSKPGRPIRASITSIIKEVGHRSWIEKRLDKLPLTAKVIKEFVESLEAFEIRKILWVEECYKREGICPTRAQFTIRASVRNKTGRTPAVQSAVNATIERLSKRS